MSDRRLVLKVSQVCDVGSDADVDADLPTKAWIGDMLDHDRCASMAREEDGMLTVRY